MSHLKVLLSAIACQPESSSEPGVAWAVARVTAQKHEVWVLAHERHRQATEDYLARNPIPNLHFVFVELPAWTRILAMETGFAQITYYVWQVVALGHARRLHREIGFDVVHHVSLQKYWMPSFLWRLPVPMVWGPVGGGESAPFSFWWGFSLRGKLYEALRSTARWLGERDPFLKLAARRSALVLATSEQSRARLEKLGPKRLSVCSGIALWEQDIARLATAGTQDPTAESQGPLPVRFLSLGRILHWKGFHLGLQAFAKARLSNAEYWVIGQGPEFERLQGLAEDLGIAEQVKFLGLLPHAQVLDRLRDCDVLVHPSLHESGGLCCLEAMAARKPVICLDLGGPALQVSDEAGIRAPARTAAESVAALAEAMTRLAGDADLRRRMGEAGHERVVRNYTWDQKVAYFDSLYQTFVGAQEKGCTPASVSGSARAPDTRDDRPLELASSHHD